MNIQITGMVWYKRENYERIRSMFDDGNNLHATYDEWLKAAETGRRSIESKGIKVVFAYIDPDEFIIWCERNGMKLNAEARNRFASETAYKAAIQQS
jgi:hypothetical protein